MAVVGRTADQFPLRLPDGMRDAIKRAASAAKRSMNSEIVMQLERIYGSAGTAVGEEFDGKSPTAAKDTGGLQSAGNIHNG